MPIEATCRVMLCNGSQVMRRIQLCIGILQFVMLFWGINVSDAKANDTKQYSDEGGWDLQMLQWSVS